MYPAPYQLTVNNHADNGSIKLNTLDLGNTDGWSGNYHTDYEISLSAQPEEGKTFSHWAVKGAKITEGDASSAAISIKLESNAVVEAVYETDVYGDVNADSIIDGRDLIRLRKYLSEVNAEEPAVNVGSGADVNGDGAIDGKDLIRLRKYFAAYSDETGCSDFPLGPD